jgi:hypothetical protein
MDGLHIGVITSSDVAFHYPGSRSSAGPYLPPPGALTAIQSPGPARSLRPSRDAAERKPRWTGDSNLVHRAGITAEQARRSDPDRDPSGTRLSPRPATAGSGSRLQNRRGAARHPPRSGPTLPRPSQFWLACPCEAPEEKVRFAGDSPLEEAVSCELVSKSRFPVTRENTANYVRLRGAAPVDL